MNVALISQHYGLPVGMGTYAVQLLASLAEQFPQDEYRLYVPRTVREPHPKNVTVVTLPAAQRRSQLTRWEHITAPLQAKRDGVDVMHFTNVAASLPITRVPSISTAYDAIAWMLPDYRLPLAYRALARRDLVITNRIITISEHAKTDLQQRLRLPERKITVTPLAGPTSDQRTAAKQPYWLFVGGSERRKNLRTVFEAIAGQGPSKLHLKVVGSTAPSPIRDSQQELLSILPAERRRDVEWLGMVNEDELTELYRHATGLLFPSTYEGFGLPVLEAMARRTPVIAANSSAIPEVAGDAAIMIDPDKPTELAHAMQKLAASPALQRKLITAGVRNTKRFTWQRTAQETHAVYRSLTS